MLRFANPEFLWLTPLALLLGGWWLLRRRPALRYSSFVLFEGLPAGRASRVKWGGAALRVLAMVSLLLACAGPRRPDLQTRVPAEGVAIVMALDVSGSMATADVPWTLHSPPVTRLEAAKRVFKLFVLGGEAPDGLHFTPRETDLIGLVTFAATPQTACPLTLNHSVLVRVLEAQKPREGVDAGTNIGDALALAVDRLDLAAKDRPKVLILLSDGEHNVFRDGPDATLMPRQSAQLAATLGVKIYTIDTGGELPETATPETRQQRLMGREILKAIATMTGGKEFNAASGAELLAAYREIDTLEKRPAASFQYRRYHEYYPWFAAAAFVLLALAHVLDQTRWRRLP
jgi:Ca-activated chloride channel family protein